MSFNFEWPSPFSPSFHAHALSLLTSALNRGPKPKVIADDIEVTELNMGSVPPDLEILEIGELGRERFRGIFRLTYAGDAHVVVQTRVQVNPLSGGAAPSDARASTTSEETFTPFASGRGILFAATPLIVPMRLTLSHVRLRAIIVLVVSKSKGITLVFKNDPLESVQVSSTFDSVAVVAKYLQQEIEGQLKEVFREDLPGIIHRLSQTWLSGRNKASEGKVAEDQAAVAGPSKSNGTRTRKRSSAASVPAAPPSQSPASPKSPHKRPPAAPRSSSAAPPSRTKPTPRPPSPPTADIPPPLSDYYQEGADSYDPTYGLREDEVRVPKDGRGFKGLKGLRRSAMDGFGGVGAIAGTSRGRGLGGLLDDDAEEHEEQEAPQDTREAADEQDQGEMVQPAGEEEEEGIMDEAEDDGLVDQEADAAEVESEEEGTQSDADDVDDEDPGQENRAPATSDDFSRFGYPPPDAEFNSEAFELASMAPRSIFDDDGRDAPSRSKTIKSNRGPRSTRSAGNASAAAQRINARRSMGTQAAPAISRHPTAPAPTLLMPGLTRSNSSASSSILSGRSPLLASTGPGSSVASHRTSPANTGGRVTPASSSSSSAAAAGPSSRPRPRVFHSSSLLQLYQPSSDGIDNGDETTSSSWGGGSATIRGARSSRLSGGGGSTLRPPRSEGGRSTAHDGSESGFASDASPGGNKAKARRMFQLAGKGKQAETPQPPTTPPEEVDRRFFHQMSLSEDDEEEEDSAGDVDDVDDVDSDEQTHSRTHSLSNSGASGTLATLEPEALPSDYSSHWGGRR